MGGAAPAFGDGGSSIATGEVRHGTVVDWAG